MKNLRVKDVLNCTKGKLIIGNENEELINYTKDTRTIQKDDVYIALKGEKFDGNLFWKDALIRGAKAVIVQDINFSKEDLQGFNDKIIIEVKDTLDALQKIAKYKRSLYTIPVIAITGSVGKTSTKDIVASVVSQKYKTLKTEGNENNHIGLPFTILSLQNHEALVIEMGMNHFKEISLLTDIAKPTISIITNIGTSHIGNLGSRENILKAKLEILEGMDEPKLIINNDNDLLHNWYEESKEKFTVYTYGIDNNSKLMAENIVLADSSSSCTIKDDISKTELHIPIGGKHFVYNALCAAMVGKILNIHSDDIKCGIETFELTKKRMDIINLKNGAQIINDSYNASYESMQASLQYLGNIKGKRKIAVLGDMFELGKFEKQLHKQVGQEVVKNKIDLLICCGKNSKYIVESAIENNMNRENIFYFENKDDIIVKLNNLLEKNDIVLIKASNGMRFYDIVEQIKQNHSSI